MIVILTALEVEYAAVHAHLGNVETHRHEAGTYVEVGTLVSRPDRRIALVTTGPGNLTAAALTERVTAEFRPAALMFVGTAGGLKDWVELGDVVVATWIYAYHGGRTEGTEFRARPRAWDLAHEVEQVARRVKRSPAWRKPLPGNGMGGTPEVHFGPVAAGDIVHNSRDSVAMSQLRSHYEDAIAVENEGAGFAVAGHLNRSVPTVTVRGISDPADGTKAAAHRDGWQPVAARNAAAFAVALAAALDDGDAAPNKRSTAAPHTPFISNTNTARDNARVGQQIGINLGDYHAGEEPGGGQE